MVKRAIITGITGQDGAYLAKLLLGKGYQVYGLLACRSSDTLWRLRELDIENDVQMINGDLTDQSSIVCALKTSQAGELYNLGSQSSVATSREQPVLTAEAGGVTVTKCLEAIRDVNAGRYVYSRKAHLFHAHTANISKRQDLVVINSRDHG